MYKFMTKLSEKNFYKLLVFIVFTILFSMIYYYFSSTNDWFINGSLDKKLSFNDAIYFSFTNMCTTGFGDITPNNDLMKKICVLQMVIFFIIVIV